jgi:hypothetical protein
MPDVEVSSFFLFLFPFVGRSIIIIFDCVAGFRIDSIRATRRGGELSERVRLDERSPERSQSVGE